MRTTRGMILAACLITLGTGCTARSAEGDSGRIGHATFRYTCCRSSDIEPVRHPGDVIRIHWIVRSDPPAPTGPASPVTLSASLEGPFASVANLKKSPSGAPQVSATPIRTTDQAGGTPVSVIRIPASAAPGAYNLTTTVELSAGSVSGGSVIRVVASDH